MGRNMGFDFGLEKSEICFKRKYRWLFLVPSISQEPVNALPPSKAARPHLSFKEMEAQHVNETVYFPAKPEWKPINLSLYELKRNGPHPVFKWIQKLYDPESNSTWRPAADGFKVNEVILELYDGCGNVIESWVFEQVWPQAVEFGDLDYSSSDVVTLDITLRYDRAYIRNNT